MGVVVGVGGGLKEKAEKATEVRRTARTGNDGRNDRYHKTRRQPMVCVV